MIVKELGLHQAGLFQASFAISSLNVALLLAAMIPDYYPRLSAAADDKHSFNRMVNEQVHVGLILAAPALAFLALAAPLALHLLYTSEFKDAALLLRLQIIGDAMRVLGWALGFALLARKLSWSYLIVEVTFTAAFLPLMWLLIPRIGLVGAGLSYLLAYSITLPTGIFLSARNAGVKVERRNVTMLVGLVAVLSSIAGLSVVNDVATILFGTLCVIAVGLLSLRELSRVGADFTPKFLRRFRAHRE
jgi:PST family polysaccharide transporter